MLRINNSSASTRHFELDRIQFTFNPQLRKRVAKSFSNYQQACDADDPSAVSGSYIELSSSVSDLFASHLSKTDWNDGWLDGVPFHSLDRHDGIISFSGLLVWGGDDGLFYLEPFQSRFELNAVEHITSYVLCFRSLLENRQFIEYTSSIARASRQIEIPDATEPIDEREWQYVFRV